MQGHHYAVTIGLLIAVSAAAGGCSDPEPDNSNKLDVRVFLPDGYYKEQSTSRDAYLPCKSPYKCQSPGGLNFCTKTGGSFVVSPGQCGASMTCGRCVLPDQGVPADLGPSPDLGAPDSAAAPDQAAPEASTPDHSGGH